MFYSPLRYPGGKSKLAKFISQICIENDINGHYVEPYAGGASVALHLLLEGYVDQISINDYDRSIYAFWHSVLKYPHRFCNSIEQIDVNIDNWYRFKAIQENKEKASLFSLGFSTFFLNRTNISGIIDAGVIGGIEQNGKYKIDCRFNKKSLISRIQSIAKYKRKINLYREDALDLIDIIQSKSKNENTIFYFDPPYYIKGPSLYINYYDANNHIEVSEKIKRIKNSHWIVSYDNVEEIRDMYSGLRNTQYYLPYTAGEKKKGKEILFFSPALSISQLDNLQTLCKMP